MSRCAKVKKSQACRSSGKVFFYISYLDNEMSGATGSVDPTAELYSVIDAVEYSRAAARAALQQSFRTIPTLGSAFSAAFESSLPELLSSVASTTEASGGHISRAALDKLTSDLSMRAMLLAGKAESAPAASASSTRPATVTLSAAKPVANAITIDAAFLVPERAVSASLAATAVLIRRIAAMDASKSGASDAGALERTRLVAALDAALRTLALFHDARGALPVSAAALRGALYPELVGDRLRLAAWESVDVAEAKARAMAEDPACILHFIHTPEFESESKEQGGAELEVMLAPPPQEPGPIIVAANPATTT